MSMNQQGYFGVQIAQRGKSGKRHEHDVAYSADIHQHLIRSFFSEPSAQLANHGIKVLMTVPTVSMRPFLQSRVRPQWPAASEIPPGAAMETSGTVESPGDKAMRNGSRRVFSSSSR